MLELLTLKRERRPRSGRKGRHGLLASLALLLAGTAAADTPGEAIPAASASADFAPPLGNFSRTAAPRRLALSLTEVLVPLDQGVRYSFTRLTLDTPFYQWEAGRKPAFGARTRVPLVLQAVPSEDRTTAGIGNLQLEGWFSWQTDGTVSRKDAVHGFRRHHAIGVGFIFPLGLALEAPVHSYFQTIDETVEALGPYFFYHFYRQGTRFDLEAEVSLGLGVQGGQSAFAFPIGTSVSLTGFYKLSPKVALMAGGIAGVYSGAVVAGLRFTPSERLEFGVGVNIPTGEWYLGLQPTVDPALELRWRF